MRNPLGGTQLGVWRCRSVVKAPLWGILLLRSLPSTQLHFRAAHQSFRRCPKDGFNQAASPCSVKSEKSALDNLPIISQHKEVMEDLLQLLRTITTLRFCMTLGTWFLGTTVGLTKDELPIWGINDPRAADSLQPIQEFQKQTGLNPMIVAWHEDFSQPFPRERCLRVWSNGRLPMILWDAELSKNVKKTVHPSSQTINLESILQKEYDLYLRDWADAAAQYGQPILIHFLYQFNHSTHPWSIGANNRDATKVKNAFRKVVSLFRDCGATNVRWVWGPHVFPLPAASWNRWEIAYPGDSFVDFLAVDGLDFGGLESVMPLNFDQLFVSPVQQLQYLAPHKPILISSVATSQSHLERQKWFQGMVRSLFGQLSNIKSVIWFNDSHWARWQAQEGDAKGLQQLLVKSQDPPSLSKFLARPFWLIHFLPFPQHHSRSPPRLWKIPYQTAPPITEDILFRLPLLLQGVPTLHLEFPSATFLGRELAQGEHFAARVRMAWNSRFLMIWCEVDDDTLGESHSEPKKIWDGDGLELAISSPNLQDETFPGQYGHRLQVSPGGSRQIKPSLALIRMNDGGLESKTDGIIFQSQFGISSSGYRIYGMIPWKTLEIEALAESKIPFDISFTDGVKGHRLRQLIWSGGAHAYHDPSEWGTLELLPP